MQDLSLCNAFHFHMKTLFLYFFFYIDLYSSYEPNTYSKNPM
jgi:hypothetical protein